MYKILIIDDLSSILKIIQAQLQSDFEVISVSNGNEALELIHTTHYDFVLCDVYLNDMNGIDIMKLCVSKQIPVAALSGRNDAEIRLECYQAGAIDFIVKPFPIQEFKLKILNTLRMLKQQ